MQKQEGSGGKHRKERIGFWRGKSNWSEGVRRQQEKKQGSRAGAQALLGGPGAE